MKVPYLLHSMREFTEIILPALQIAGSRNIVEIGSENGEMTEALCEFVEKVGGSLLVIDPNPGPNTGPNTGPNPGPNTGAFGNSPKQPWLMRAKSLDVLPQLDLADAYLIDGDHNYYTVYHELKCILSKARKDGPLIFLHDVGWPCAKRDFYYSPETIPREYRHDHSYSMAVIPNSPILVEAGFGGAGNFAIAKNEGGPRNGVLTAIEDILKNYPEQFSFYKIQSVFGLGILIPHSAQWRSDVARLIQPFVTSRLLERLEKNRVELYTQILIKNQRIIALEAANNDSKIAEPSLNSTSLKVALEAIQTGKYKLLSIDVFDTLLWRRVRTPSDVFLLVGQKLLDAGYLRGISKETFRTLRIEAEQLARAKLPCGIGEITLEEIYNQFPPHILTIANLEYARNVEVETEQELIELDWDIASIILAASARGIPYVLSSDMYLSRVVIESLFHSAVTKSQERLKFPKPKEVFVSSEYRTSKRGELFLRLLKACDIRASEVLHIGDDAGSDGAGPKQHGVDALHIQNTYGWQEKILQEETTVSGLDNGLQSLRLRASRSLGMDATYETIGAFVYGPILYGFCEWVIKELTLGGHDRVYLPLREGRQLSILLNRYARAKGITIVAEEMAISRLVAKRAALQSGTSSELLKFLETRNDLSPREISLALGLTEAEVRQALPVPNETMLTHDALSALCGRLAKCDALREKILAYALDQRARLFHYLRQIGFLADGKFSSVICDLGWSGTIQTALGSALMDSKETMSIEGLYLITTEAIQSVLWNAGKARGYLFDAANRQEESEFLSSRELLELILMPKLGALSGFSEAGTPIQSPICIPEIQQEQIQMTFHGVERYFDHALRCGGNSIGDCDSQKIRLRAILARSASSPISEEIELFGKWRHETNSASDHVEQILPDLTAVDHLFGGKSFLEIARLLRPQRIYWPAAALLKFGGRSFTDLFRVYSMGLLPERLLERIVLVPHRVRGTGEAENPSRRADELKSQAQEVRDMAQEVRDMEWAWKQEVRGMEWAWKVQNDELISYMSSPLTLFTFQLRRLGKRFPKLKKAGLRFFTWPIEKVKGLNRLLRRLQATRFRFSD